MEKGAIEKITLTDKKQMNRVLKGGERWELPIEEVRAQFEITDELKDFFRVNEVEL